MRGELSEVTRARYAIKDGTASDEQRALVREYLRKYEPRRLRTCVTREEARMVQERADAQGTTVSAWLAQMIRRFLHGTWVNAREHERVVKRLEEMERRHAVLEEESTERAVQLHQMRRKLESTEEQLRAMEKTLMQSVREAVRRDGR